MQHIHADLYEDIIDHVLHFTRQTVNLDLVQILPKLLVTSEPKAKHIIEQIGHVLLKLAAMPPTVSFLQELKIITRFEFV